MVKQPLALAFTLVLAGLAFSTASACAETTGPVWKILSVANPTNFKPGDQTGDDAIVVTAVNVGGASTGCTAEQIAEEPRPEFSPLRPCPAGSPVVSPVTISDVVPGGMTAVEVYGDNAYDDPLGQPAGEAQANSGTCGAESLIGEAAASVGVGQRPVHGYRREGLPDWSV